MEEINFFIELDPVVFDCFIVDKISKKRLRKATSEEWSLWQALNNLAHRFAAHKVEMDKKLSGEH